MCTDEQKRLTASWLNILGAGAISAGCVTQLVAISIGDRTGAAALAGAAIALVCVIAGSGLHLIARAVLGQVGTCVECGPAARQNKAGTTAMPRDIVDYVDMPRPRRRGSIRRRRRETLLEAFRRESARA